MPADSWPFSVHTSVASVLELLSQASSMGDSRFPARNFRLEWQLPRDRIASYSSIVKPAAGITDPFDALKQLNRLHNQYLSTHIRHGSRMSKFDEASADCPESFGPGSRLDEFGHSEDGLLLVRLEELR